MKIGFLTYSLGGGGAERVLTELADELIRQEYEVDIFVFDAHNIKYSINSKIRIVYCREQENKENYIERLKRLRQKIREEKVDIFFAFSLSMAGLARLSTIGMAVKVVGSERANPKMYSKKQKLLMKWVIPFCHGMVFQTKGAKNCYPKCVQRKGIVIPNPAPQIKKLAPVMNSDMIRICSVGRLAYPKDYQTLLKAYQKYLLLYPQSRLSIYGEGVLKEELLSLAKTLGIENKVTFLGFKKEIISELKNYDMFVFSSRAEGMPNALIEAMAAGLPCIATDCEFGPVELIQNAENGLLVPIGDVDAMAENMCWIARNKEKAILMGKEASKVQQKYSRRKIYDQYIAYLDKI